MVLQWFRQLSEQMFTLRKRCQNLSQNIDITIQENTLDNVSAKSRPFHSGRNVLGVIFFAEIWWRHQPRYRPFVRRIHWSLVSNAGFGVFFDVTLNKRVYKHSSAGDLRRCDGHYDVTVILLLELVWCLKSSVRSSIFLLSMPSMSPDSYSWFRPCRVDFLVQTILKFIYYRCSKVRSHRLL